MERKINLLIEYLYEFKDTITKAEVQKILKRLKDCGVNKITCGKQEYELTNDYIKQVQGVC